jgi:hypothetical protein
MKRLQETLSKVNCPRADSIRAEVKCTTFAWRRRKNAEKSGMVKKKHQVPIPACCKKLLCDLQQASSRSHAFHLLGPAQLVVAGESWWYNALTVCSLAPDLTTGVPARISNLTVEQCISMRKKGIDLESVSERFQRSQLLVFSMVVGLSKERFLNLGLGPLSKVSR